jgi:acetyl esterase/lipase
MVGLLAMLLLEACAAAADKPVVMDVWPGKPPGETGPIDAEHLLEQKPGERVVQRLTNISQPTISILRPAREKDTGVSVLICPGGGYNILAWDLEGEEVAAWLNSIGVTGIVLKYRVPRRPGQAKDEPPIGPLQDAQRGLSLIRSKAKEWSLDPNRIGILGFSAGGHLAAAASTNFDRRAYAPLDDLDKVSCRPDFAVLVYPAYLAARDKDELKPDIRVRKDCPPMFLVHADDDRLKSDNSVLMYLALKRAGVPAELHVYARGGHGFGLRPSDDPCSTWPQRCAEWLRSQGFIKQSASAPSSQNPSPMVEHTRVHERIKEQRPAGQRMKLTLGNLFVPEKLKAGSSVPLFVHFHGGTWLPEVAASSTEKAVITVQLGSGSAAYARPFADPQAFDRFLREAEEKSGMRFGPIGLTAWSAGYGAVREILKTPANYERVQFVILLDGLHAGYEGGQPGPGESKLVEKDLEAFVRFARDAAAGKKQFVLTHSEVFPGTFASTTETADYLLRQVDLKRQPVLRWGPLGMQQLSEVRQGKLVIAGYAGNSAPDHVDHLHGLAEFLKGVE